MTLIFILLLSSEDKFHCLITIVLRQKTSQPNWVEEVMANPPPPLHLSLIVGTCHYFAKIWSDMEKLYLGYLMNFFPVYIIQVLTGAHVKGY